MAETTDERPDEPTAAEDVQETPQEVAEGAEGEQDDHGDPVAAARREAASYRRRLRDVEAERDRTAQALQTYQRREVEQLAERGGAFGAGAMNSGSDLWLAGVQLGDLLGEDGTVDPTKTQEVIKGVLADRPHWRRAPVDIGMGPRSGGATSGPSFADVLRRATTG